MAAQLQMPEREDIRQTSSLNPEEGGNARVSGCNWKLGNQGTAFVNGIGNHSTITEFLLLQLSADPHVWALLFVLFLGIYLLTLMGNLMMLLVIGADSHLHTPRYFFLSRLSFADLCFSSVTVPKMLENLLSQKKTISVEGCLAQVFFVFVTAGTEACILSVMGYDRYAAICHPLLYGQITNKQLYMHLVWGSRGLGFLGALINIFLAMNMVFCEAKIIHHYSCEMPSLFPLFCSDVSRNFIALLCSTLVHGLGPFLFVFLSYTRIMSTILSISSTSGRSKAFSTCSSHLTAVTLHYGSGLLRHLMPNSGSTTELSFSVQYTVVTPTLNPLIYSLKNKEVKAALKTTFEKCLKYISYEAFHPHLAIGISQTGSPENSKFIAILHAQQDIQDLLCFRRPKMRHPLNPQGQASYCEEEYKELNSGI
ncbi:olfactory receptor 8S1 [Cynocephalus volans]|uniref:olfactory receptor 8S1 n=1 Tax=Cynocephalus volans TaxID=110931 RepID=UPI002FC5EC15